MESQPQTQEISPPPTLSLFSLRHPKHLKKHHQHTKTFTSSLQTSISIPFSWEEQPGKPLPCLTLSLPTTINNKCLELPPRLTNTLPSPTSILELEGPYNLDKSYSFRFLRKKQGSFDGSLSLRGTGASSPGKGVLAPVCLSRSSSSISSSCNYNNGLFGYWKTRGRHNFKNMNDVQGNSFVFPNFFNIDENISGCDGEAIKVTRKANFLNLSPVKSNFWVEICGAFKQVLQSPRTSKNVKKDAW